jgi:hypothetical protein
MINLKKKKIKSSEQIILTYIPLCSAIILEITKEYVSPHVKQIKALILSIKFSLIIFKVNLNIKIDLNSIFELEINLSHQLKKNPEKFFLISHYFNSWRRTRKTNDSSNTTYISADHILFFSKIRLRLNEKKKSFFVSTNNTLFSFFRSLIWQDNCRSNFRNIYK